MRVSVDSSRCQGHGLCAALSPGLFELDDVGRSRMVDGLATLPSLPQEWVSEAIDSMESCPEEAIVLEPETNADREQLR